MLHQPVRACAQPRPQPKPTHTDFLPVAIQPYVSVACHLMVFTPIIHVNTWITIYLTTLEGWKA